MVVSSGFLDHAAEVYLRTNGLIMSAQSPITSLNVNRTATEWSQSQPPQSTASNTPQVPTNFIKQSKVHRSFTAQLNEVIYFRIYECSPLQLQPPLQQSTPPNQSNMQVANVKMNNNGQLSPARAILICHPNSHPFQVCVLLMVPPSSLSYLLLLLLWFSDAKYSAGATQWSQSWSFSSTQSCRRIECHFWL